MNETAEQFIARKKANPDTVARMASPSEDDNWELVIEASTYFAQSTWDRKVYVIQRLSGAYISGSSIEYRIGYYKLMDDGHWGWMQGSPMFPLQDLEMLLALARVEGTIL